MKPNGLFLSVIVALLQLATIAKSEPLGTTALNGELTVKYRAHLVYCPKAGDQQLPESQVTGLRYLVRGELESHAKGKVSDAVVNAALAKEVKETIAAGNLNRPAVSFTVTISGHAGSLLYQLSTDQDPSQIHSGISSGVTVTNGAQTYSRFYTDDRVNLLPDFHSECMQYLPIFCSGYGGVSFIRTPTQDGNNSYKANVLWPGTFPNYYCPATITADTVQGVPRIKQIAYFGQGQKLREFDFGGHTLFGATWIPKQIEMIAYDRRGDPSPTWTCQYVMTSITNTSVDPSLFHVDSQLKPGMLLTVEKNGDPVTIGYTDDKSIDAQSQEAYLGNLAVRSEGSGNVGRRNPLTAVFALLSMILAIAAYTFWARLKKK